jgi:hypothetical protein
VGLLRIVVVQVSAGALGCRVFFCTDATRTMREILKGYAGRWAIEVCFRNLKQDFGFAQSSARLRTAVERVAPLVGLTYTLVVAWFTEYAHTHPLAAPPVRPWYRHKQGCSFADVLRTAQRVLAPLDVWIHAGVSLTCGTGPQPPPRDDAAHRSGTALHNGET